MDEGKNKRGHSDRGQPEDVLSLDDFRASPDIDEQALIWVARLSDKATRSNQQDRAFIDWLIADKSHKQAFDTAAELWELAGTVVADPKFKPVPRYNQFLPSLAAGIALLMVAVITTLLSPIIYSTNAGEQQRVILSDGSTAFLNTDTKIAVSYFGDERSVDLVYGEAWFDVVTDPDRSFVVAGGDLTAQALGTSFAVRNTLLEQSVTVTEGTVRVATANLEAQRSAVVESGAQIILDQNQLQADKYDDQALAWRRGQLIYQDEPLSVVLQDLSRYIPPNLSLSEEEIGQRRVSAVIRLGDQQAMLDALTHSLELNWKAVADDLVVITTHTPL